MISFKPITAFAATCAMLSLASADSSSSSKIVSIPTPTATLKASAMQEIGCFATGVPLEDHGVGQFVSPGSCQQICLGLNKDVLGLSDGERCWCGDKFPPLSAKIDNGTCNTPCSGTDVVLCGGNAVLWIMTTGNTRNQVEYFQPSSSSSSSTTSLKTLLPPAVVTATVVPPTSEPVEKSGPSKVGIAVGVIVGVVALSAIIGGVVFFLRRQKKKAVEDEYRRQAAANAFVAGGKLHTSNSSMNDSRLDPDFQGRRQSNGSIADNEDYSRRILKVTNA